MASRFWTFVANLVPGALARAEHINAKFLEVDAALSAIASEMNRCIRFTSGAPGTQDFQLGQSAGQRANTVIGFDGVGGVQLRALGFSWRGDWDDDVSYAANDAVRAPGSHSNSIYIALVAHQSGADFAADLAAGRWQLMIDLTDTQAAARQFKQIAGAYDAVAGDDLFVDTSTAPVSITLPALPAISDQPIKIVHAKGDAGVNPVTILRNGKLINGQAADLVITTTGGQRELAFVDDSVGWRVISSS